MYNFKPKRYIVISELEIVWIPIYRNGTTSLSCAIAKKFGIDVMRQKHPFKNKDFQRRFVRHIWNDRYNKFKLIAVTRNPYTRYQSTYSIWKIKRRKLWNRIDDKIHVLKADNKHWCPQIEILKGHISDIGNIHLFKLEEIKELAKLYDLDMEQKLNQSKQIFSLTDKRIQIVNKHYAEDFVLGGYEKYDSVI